jgi:hypothetical protein
MTVCALCIGAVLAAYLRAWWCRQRRLEERVADVEEFLYGRDGSANHPHATGMLTRVLMLEGQPWCDEEEPARSRAAIP